ncbi:MAG TPA: hypothetical protein VGM20_08850 [Gemmatimonadales bacterium]|jgi:hypothetical protein
MITETTYYRASLFLPMLTPVLAWVEPVRVMAPKLAMTLGASLMLMLPYLMFALLLSTWMTGKTQAAVRRAMYYAPVLLIPFVGLWFLLIALVAGPRNVFSVIPTLLWLTPITLIIGYCYVLPVVLIRVVASRARFIAPA